MSTTLATLYPFERRSASLSSSPFTGRSVVQLSRDDSKPAPPPPSGTPNTPSLFNTGMLARLRTPLTRYHE